MTAAFIAGRQFFSAQLHFFAGLFAAPQFMAEFCGFQPMSAGQILPHFCRCGGKTGPLTT
tara:strand:- start:3594 stop:3773 length:180 start_codon:yes stop_codon:yes gene_type:complete